VVRITVLFLSLLIIAGPNTPSQAAPSGEKARITAMVGSVEVRSGESATWRKARVGMPVVSGWDIRTYLESTAEITFESGTVVKVGENTVLTISRLMNNQEAGVEKSTIKVASGKVWGNVKKLAGSRSEFDFETPTAVASIRGTRLGVFVEHERTQVDVYEGIVLVRKKDSNRSVPLMMSNRAVVSAGSEDIEVIEFKKLKKNDSGDSASAPVDPFSTPSSQKDSTIHGTQPSDTASPEKPAQGAYLQIMSPVDKSIVKETPVVIKGKSKFGATVVILDKVIDVGNDGTFSSMIDLKPGTNIFPVFADYKGIVNTIELNVEYRPPVLLNVNNLTNNMEINSRDITVDLEVSEGARFSVNGREGEKRVYLSEGSNIITVEAWDQWNSRLTRKFVVIYRQPESFELNVASPIQGATIREPMIVVTGSTAAGAQVAVNNIPVQTGPDGFFTAKVPIPDEPQEYEINVIAKYDGKEITVTRHVTYNPVQGKLILEMVTPLDNQKIQSKLVHVSGKTSPRATVTVNGHTAMVNSSGVFTTDIMVSEMDIGDMNLEVVARYRDDEVSRSIPVNVDVGSSQINVSAPILSVQPQGIPATRNGRLLLHAVDRTPDDQITFSATVNGATEQITTVSGGNEYVNLSEGKNSYSIKATDKAGNISTIISGQVYCLPGPLTITVNDPSENPYIIRGLPPLPRGYSTPEQDIDIEIDDGIGGVPETIKYCKITGNGQTLLLRSSRDYHYTGKVPLFKGGNVYIIQVEDIAGNVITHRLDIQLY